MEWKVSPEPVPYLEAVDRMEARVTSIRTGTGQDLIWLLEHPPLYTAGTSAREEDLLSSALPVFKTGRGGQYTYHGPGQRIVYAVIDLRKRSQEPDIRKYIQDLEQWVIDALALLSVRAERRTGRVGLWVNMEPYGEPSGKERKIAAIGVRVRNWVAYHGLSINVNPDLSHFDGIVPCGIREHGTTSLHALGRQEIGMPQLDKALKETCPFAKA